jgi:hypothetical protein
MTNKIVCWCQISRRDFQNYPKQGCLSLFVVEITEKINIQQRIAIDAILTSDVHRIFPTVVFKRVF